MKRSDAAQAEALRAAFLFHAILLRGKLGDNLQISFVGFIFPFSNDGRVRPFTRQANFYITSTSAPEIQDDLKPNSEFLWPQSLHSCAKQAEQRILRLEVEGSDDLLDGDFSESRTG